MSEESPAFNPQLYLNSCAAGGLMEEVAQENPERLHNRTLPNLVIQHEKAEHRLAIILKATQGLSNRDIAKALDKTEAWLSQLFRQPWAQEALIREMNKNGGDSLRLLIESEAANNVFTIVKMRDDPNAPAATRLNAANSLLDRFMGKAPEKVSVDVKTHVANDIESVDRELASLQQEEARLCGKTQAANVDATSLPGGEAAPVS